MSIKRMMLLAGMALTAIAFAAPAVAQADVRLTDSKGKTLPLNSEVTATSTDLQTVTAAGTLTCLTVTLHYKLTANGPNQVVLQPVGTHNATPEKCHLTTNDLVTKHTTHITNAGTGQLAINTWGTGETDATFTSLITSPTPLHCTFTGKVHVQGAAPNTDVINVGPSALAGAPQPPCPNGTISGTATMETSNGKEAKLDFVKTG